MTRDDRLREGAARLVSAFYADDTGLLDDLRRQVEDAERRNLLREVVKIQDDAFLNRLIALGITPESALALALIPLVCVAWADGKLDDKEREAILRAAAERGGAAERIGRRLLERNLSRPPDPRLLTMWKAHAGALWGCFTADERWRMRRNVLQSARDVAEAAGGFLGLTSRLSPEERKLLEELESFLD